MNQFQWPKFNKLPENFLKIYQEVVEQENFKNLHRQHIVVRHRKRCESSTYFLKAERFLHNNSSKFKKSLF